MNKDKIRVLALSDHLGYADGRVHGGTTYFVNVFPKLIEAGIDLTACFMRAPHPAVKLLTTHGVNPIFLNKHKYDPRVVGIIKKIILDKGIQILHLASLKSHLIGRFLAERLGCKTIIHLHDTTPLSPAMKILERWMSPNTDLALAVSKPVAAFGTDQYRIPPEKIKVLNYGIDIQSFRAVGSGYRSTLCREFSVSEDSLIIGMVGRLDPMKGQEYAVQAMPMVLKRCPKAVLIIFGEGSRRKALQGMIQELGLDRHIFLAGQRDNIPAILAALDIMAMPSVSGEGLPFAAIEAIAAGKPVVAFPTAGLPEVVVDNVSGMLVPKGDVSALAQTMSLLLLDNALRERLSRGAMKHSENFSIQGHVQKLLAIYQSLIAPSS